LKRQQDKTLKEVVWEGDSKEVLTSFPEEVKRHFGFEIYGLQVGEEP
jgi:phage-related protein